MGIVKVRHRGPGNGSHVQRSGNVLVKQERLVLDKDPRNDSDDDEFAEVGCELAMVGDQTFSVPYDLYDLPNLKDILSLDTWNSCLTDEERFSLAAYLPDMDQETFWLTMQDLLSGDNLFFGNPLEELFRRLKGGYYTLKKFADMKKTWNDRAPNGGVEERIHIWNSLKTSKPLLLVDLNAFPSDDEILCKADKTVTGIQLLKKPKYSDKEGVIRHVAPNTVNELGLNTKMKAKGVLKIKPVDVNSKQTYIVQPLPSDPWGLCRQPPKGVLRIKPKHNPPGPQERLTALPLLPELTSAEVSSLPEPRFPRQQFALDCKQENFNNELSLLHQTGRDVKMYRSPELPDVVHSQQRDNFPYMSTQISKRKMRLLNDMRLHNAAEIQDTLPLRMYSNDIGRIGEHGNGENLWLNPGELGKGYYGSPAEPFSFPLEHQGRRKIRPVPQTVSGAISTVSSVGSDKHHIFPISPGQSEDLKHHHIDQSNEFEMPPLPPDHFRGPKEVHVFPITYKRKKPHIKLNNMESLKQPMAIANSEPMVLSGTDRLPTEKTKPIKIKVKGFSDYNVQFKQGMLNGLQRGSPST
ncbi:hypothetical protein J5N97_026345 [Dioscorea zingiberensis]|uniref:DEUBAD domain-containing protein n=1 Tax=Dioscorea zingiberensis TaxID=325984 RepID=A0A9D5H6Q6_9LILI|nr:hypothetical protein J5N97_026345 [Dioscorea zingiberensis]